MKDSNGSLLTTTAWKSKYFWGVTADILCLQSMLISVIQRLRLNRNSEKSRNCCLCVSVSSLTLFFSKIVLAVLILCISIHILKSLVDFFKKLYNRILNGMAPVETLDSVIFL